MYKEKIDNFISENSEKALFTGGVTEKQILDVEKRLNIQLPDSYRWFLKKYGHGIMFGVEILGCGKSNMPAVVKETERYRKLGMPIHYIPIQNFDEWVDCLDLNTSDGIDCKIVSWDSISQKGEIVSDGFCEYLIISLEDGKELLNDEF